MGLPFWLLAIVFFTVAVCCSEDGQVDVAASPASSKSWYSNQDLDISLYGVNKVYPGVVPFRVDLNSSFYELISGEASSLQVGVQCGTSAPVYRRTFSCRSLRYFWWARSWWSTMTLGTQHIGEDTENTCRLVARMNYSHYRHHGHCYGRGYNHYLCSLWGGWLCQGCGCGAGYWWPVKGSNVYYSDLAYQISSGFIQLEEPGQDFYSSPIQASIASPSYLVYSPTVVLAPYRRCRRSYYGYWYYDQDGYSMTYNSSSGMYSGTLPSSVTDGVATVKAYHRGRGGQEEGEQRGHIQARCSLHTS
ncbi:hypothetical protein KIPB_004666 [Kipferlia bialata]|uniref:Uncharacterized protein n=1 Tax=Kipferlia bialata TaxID=797122 RepID=A0A9K3CVV2_9EUKA|nr:hypothetical protein KIPB_004666 [Kipferlia bialata]|eukprot:g4666.t1